MMDTQLLYGYLICPLIALWIYILMKLLGLFKW